MTVEHIELLVEEPSMEAAVRVLLPRLLAGLSFPLRSTRISARKNWLPGYPTDFEATVDGCLRIGE